MMTAFVLRGRREIPADDASPGNEVYDREQQIWIDSESRLPVVSTHEARIENTKFGETLLTATREGADQSEISTLQGSPFGETTMTKTSEGADQREITAIGGTNFGETLLTRSQEGADQSEITDASVGDIADADALASVRSASVPFDAPYSHF